VKRRRPVRFRKPLDDGPAPQVHVHRSDFDFSFGATTLVMVAQGTAPLPRFWDWRRLSGRLIFCATIFFKVPVEQATPAGTVRFVSYAPYRRRRSVATLVRESPHGNSELVQSPDPDCSNS
jgi:hypothetical protein